MSAAFMATILCPSGRTVRTSPSSDSTRTCSPGSSSCSVARVASLPELAVHEDEAVLAHLADRRRRSAAASTATAPAPYLHGLAERERPDSRRGRPRLAITSGFDVLYGAGAFWKSMIAARPRGDQPGHGERAVRRHVHVDRRATRAPRSDQREPAQLIGRTEKPKSAVTSATAPSAPGSTTPGMEDLEADPGEAGEEEQREDVRVDQRVEQAREETQVHVVDLGAGGVERVAARLRLHAVELARAAPAASARSRRSRSCCSASGRRERSWPRAPRGRPSRRCGRGSARALAATPPRR